MAENSVNFETESDIWSGKVMSAASAERLFQKFSYGGIKGMAEKDVEFKEGPFDDWLREAMSTAYEYEMSRPLSEEETKAKDEGLKNILEKMDQINEIKNPEQPERQEYFAEHPDAQAFLDEVASDIHGSHERFEAMVNTAVRFDLTAEELEPLVSLSDPKQIEEVGNLYWQGATVEDVSEWITNQQEHSEVTLDSIFADLADEPVEISSSMEEMDLSEQTEDIDLS